MKIMVIVGARPNFMKAAPIIRAVQAHNHLSEGAARIHQTLVHTGQHYDRLMSDSFFADLGLPEPDYNLGVGSGSHAAQTADIMSKFEHVLLRERPDILLVLGDVNSTLACALVAAKISFDPLGTRPVIAHVEAGLRSFDRTMPEEINRMLTDRISDLLFITEESARENLIREGAPPDCIHFVGNTMIDSLLDCKQRSAASSTILEDLAVGKGRYALLTLHRPANVDDEHSLAEILSGLDELPAECPIVFPAHPRTVQRFRQYAIGAGAKTGIRMIAPLRYPDFLRLMEHARLVITDSGGVQEETTCLNVPCVTVRENTERPVTVTAGTNILAGVKAEGIRAAIRMQMRQPKHATALTKWDGGTAARIVDVLVTAWQQPASVHLQPAVPTTLATGGELV